MRAGAGLILLFMLVLWSSCRSDFEPEETYGQLQFSRDTVFLDTVFSNLTTSTYSLKVYNRSREDIFIPEISLASGENSLYRLNVDGVPGKSFVNIEVLAKDSIYIFVETTVPAERAEQNEFLYVDKLQFKSRAHIQEVPLVTLVKDAIFLFPQRNSEGLPGQIPVGVDESGEPQTVTGFFLDDEHLKLTAEKPYVIYGYAAVPEGKTLEIEAGARLHFHSDSGIIVPANASLNINGRPSEDPEKLEKEVILQSDRLEEMYQNVPGQWGTIWLQKGGRDHLFEHVTIKNAEVGILIEGEENSLSGLGLKNVQIYNSAASGIWAENAEITAKNLVINNSGSAALHLRAGYYSFKHSTIVNYWQQSYRQFPAVFIENILSSGTAPLQVNFFNSIIFGSEKRELLFNADASADFELLFSHTLIKFDAVDEDNLYDFSNNNIYKNIRLNEEPIFFAPKENDLRLQENSAAIDRGDPEVAKQVPLDLNGNNRTPAPDLGAYEYVEPEE